MVGWTTSSKGRSYRFVRIARQTIRSVHIVVGTTLREDSFSGDEHQDLENIHCIFVGRRSSLEDAVLQNQRLDPLEGALAFEACGVGHSGRSAVVEEAGDRSLGSWWWHICEYGGKRRRTQERDLSCCVSLAKSA